MKGKIYLITNTINNKVYVGQTLLSVAVRWQSHIMSSRLEDTKFYRAINKYGKENFQYKIIEEVVEELLHDREKYWIKYYDSYNNGYNSTLGGDGNRRLNYDKIYLLWKDGNNITQIANKLNYGRVQVSKVLKEKFSITKEEINKRRYIIIVPASLEEILEKWRIENKSLHQIAKELNIRYDKLKRYLIQNGIKEEEFKKRAHQIHRKTTNEELLEFWKNGLTISAISREYGGGVNTISQRLKELGITQEEINKRKNLHVNQNAKPVVQLDLNNNYINSFPSSKKAGESLGKPSTSINACCNKRKGFNTAYGYKWVFKEDYDNKIK